MAVDGDGDGTVINGLPAPGRLRQQLNFLLEVDRLKQVFRQTYLLDSSRKENDAEHSWHLAMLAMVLAEYAPTKINVLRVIQMVLVHDIVEIDAGDTFCYDEAGYCTKPQREQAAADRIFNILPPDQALQMRQLWEEFEARQSGEAKFAAAIDRLQPLLANYVTGGRAWQEHGVTVEKVLARNRHISEGAPEIWSFVEAMIGSAVERGFLRGCEPAT